MQSHQCSTASANSMPLGSLRRSVSWRSRCKLQLSSRASILLCCIWFTALAASASSLSNAAEVDVVSPADRPRSEEAYVTLLYGEDFILGARVLGQSLRESGTKRDLVLLSTGGLSEEAEDILWNDGWIVRRVDTVQNPGKWSQAPSKKFPTRFWAVYTKLGIFNLTEYKKVCFLDADTIVLQNMDDVFKCQGFCAVLRHSERLNSGVMVVEPSTELYQHMMSRIAELPSYTGGDQGFLNSYFPEFPNAPVFEPGREYGSAESHIRMMRLPTAYNADIGLYVVNSNRWAIPPRDIKVMHFTLGAFKPWNWWTLWLIDEVSKWQGFRYRLPKTPSGLRHGDTRIQVLARFVLIPLPLLLAWLLVYRYLWRNGFRAYILSLAAQVVSCCTRRASSPHAGSLSASSSFSSLPLIDPHLPNSEAMPRCFAFISILAGFSSLAAGIIFARRITPSEVRPLYGYILMYEWGLLVFAALCGFYLQACYTWGRSSATPASKGSTTSYSKPWPHTLAFGLLGISLIILCPWVGDLLGTTAFVAKILVGMGSVMVSCVVLTHIFVQISSYWYICGRAHGLHD